MEFNHRTSETHPLQVDFIELENCHPAARLGMTFAPGKIQLNARTGSWKRNLAQDLRRLKELYQTDTLVSLIEEKEFERLQITDIDEECEKQGIELRRFPIKDFSIPESMEKFSELIVELAERLKNGKTIIVHCKGGLGRTGLVAACVLTFFDEKINATEAIQKVRESRAGTVETIEQEQFIKDFADYSRIS